jgi:hypothetical protein
MTRGGWSGGWCSHQLTRVETLFQPVFNDTEKNKYVERSGEEREREREREREVQTEVGDAKQVRNKDPLVTVSGRSHQRTYLFSLSLIRRETDDLS